MDAACSNRIGNGLFLLRDWVDQKGRHTAAVGNARRPDVGVRLRPTLRAAGIDPLITFTLFRHGGLTELGDSELTDAQIINPDRAGRPNRNPGSSLV